MSKRVNFSNEVQQFDIERLSDDEYNDDYDEQEHENNRKHCNDNHEKTKELDFFNNDEECEFIMKLLNNYVDHYKKQHNLKNNFNMLEDINHEDMTSTNAIMELFYEEMYKFDSLTKSNTDDTLIHKYSDRHNIDVEDELYGVSQDGVVKVVSKSFFACLIEMTNMQDECENKNTFFHIINLK